MIYIRFSNKPISCFKSYLTNRALKVNFNGVFKGFNMWGATGIHPRTIISFSFLLMICHNQLALNYSCMYPVLFFSIKIFYSIYLFFFISSKNIQSTNYKRYKKKYIKLDSSPYFYIKLKKEKMQYYYIWTKINYKK